MASFNIFSYSLRNPKAPPSLPFSLQFASHTSDSLNLNLLHDLLCPTHRPIFLLRRHMMSTSLGGSFGRINIEINFWRHQDRLKRSTIIDGGKVFASPPFCSGNSSPGLPLVSPIANARGCKLPSFFFAMWLNSFYAKLTREIMMTTPVINACEINLDRLQKVPRRRQKSHRRLLRSSLPLCAVLLRDT